MIFLCCPFYIAQPFTAPIMQDGEDAVVTCTLTEKARRVTVECGDLANQDIPSLRIVFREYVWHMDEP